MSRKIYSIEGNIGSGKSTLLSKLTEYFNREKENISRPIIFLQEPIDEWMSIKDAAGNTILQKFYADQERYSFPFQMMAYISRLALLKKSVEENPDAIIICERSLLTDKYVFAQMLYDDNKIESVNYQIYLKWFDTFATDFQLAGIVYLETNPTTCHNRVKLRKRDGEEIIPLDYLTKCSVYHDSMIENSRVPILHINGNLIIDDMVDIWIQNVKVFVNVFIPIINN